MIRYIICCLLAVVAFLPCVAQTEQPIQSNMKTELPYYEIPEAPDSYNAGNVLARIIDGLGFRYYWATEGLRPEDLAYKPSVEARTTDETLDHVLGLTEVIANAINGKINERPLPESTLTFEEKRKQTLEFIKLASDLLKSSHDGDMDNYKVVFKRGDNTSESPFWNLLNGPIDDALWHVGQVVTFRRSSGNPLNPKVSVFSGKLRE